MPPGRVVTHMRARRRQSDAKWRAGVAMCYNIMKNAVPNQKKLGRRKISKALIIKETERHIIQLERKIKELIQERAPMCGRTVMFETEDNVCVPVTFEDIKQDFAEKQHSLFVCSSSAGRKRYSVPPDIESNLHQMRQLSCDLTTVNKADVNAPTSSASSSQDTNSNKISPINRFMHCATKDQIVPSEYQHASFSDHLPVVKQHKTPVKKQGSVCNKNMTYIQVDKGHYTSTPLKIRTGVDTQSSSQSSMYTSDGFTPIKLPYGLDMEDPMMALPITPANASDITTLSTISIPQSLLSPGCNSTTKMEEYFDIEDENHLTTGLLCTETIDSVGSMEDMSSQLTSGNTTQNSTLEKSKCRRRLDKDYDTDQTVPTSVGDVTTGITDDSCLDFDGYLLFHKHNSSLLDPSFSQSEIALTTADMWENLEPDDRATYSKMAALEHSDDSNDLSADLLGIELRPLHKEHNETLSGIMTLLNDEHEVPCHLTEISDEVHQSLHSDLQFVEGYEDLGVFYPSTDDKTLANDFSGRQIDWEDNSQIVPEM